MRWNIREGVAFEVIETRRRELDKSFSLNEEFVYLRIIDCGESYDKNRSQDI